MKKIILISALTIIICLVSVLLIKKLTTSQIPISPNLFSWGVYEACADPSECNLETGIKKIKEAGAQAVIVTVTDEDDLESTAYYPSQYLPLADGISGDYLKRIIGLARQNQIKVYALINMPHNYWLARHPEWIAVLSNGQRADAYEKDYFHRTVPPSRIIAEEESRELLKNIIKEVISYGVDGIDINDNFQFSGQYLEETGTTLFSSFDDFTIKKFEKETGLVVQGNSPKERADYLKDQPLVYERWLSWRAGQITQLLKILKQDIKDTGRDLPLRPHLLTSEEPYQYYGLDYKGIAEEADVLYLMIGPEQPKGKYFEIIKQSQDLQAKKIVASIYLLKEIGEPDTGKNIEENKEKILERIEWLREAGANEIYVYNFELMERGDFWMDIKNVF